MRILIYYSNNKHSVPFETMIFLLQAMGHQVVLLSPFPRGLLHETLEERGIKTDSIDFPKGNPVRYYLRHARHLARYVKSGQFDLVFSHLQPASLMAVLARRFYGMKRRLVVFRHHDWARSRNERMGDWLINKWAPQQVVPSESVRQLIIRDEGLSPAKIQTINYCYDFSRYQLTSPEAVQAIQEAYPAKLRVAIVSRHMPEKRHLVAFRAINALIKEGLDIQVLVPDRGPETEKLNAFISANQCAERFHMLGFREDIFDFIAACDVLVHPSISDTSCSVAKEAGLAEKIVIACRDIGAFNEYIFPQENGILIDPQPDKESENQIREALREIYYQPAKFQSFGLNLRKEVLSRFGDRSRSKPLYQALIEGKPETNLTGC